MTITIRQGGGALAVALLLSLTVVGCGSTNTTSTGASSSALHKSAAGSEGSETSDVAKGFQPAAIRIPKIDAESTLVPVAVGLDGKISVPPVTTPMQAAWYRFSPAPGEIGPAIVLGHVDGEKKPGIFYRLKELAPGDEIDIDRKDGKKLKFVVNHRDQVPKDAFPDDAVYGNSDKPQLRLITCGGVFDHAEHSYKDNIVVYADLVNS